MVKTHIFFIATNNCYLRYYLTTLLRSHIKVVEQLPLVQVHNIRRSIHGNVGFVYSIYYQVAEIRYVIMYLV
jgi:hypothetical protein